MNSADPTALEQLRSAFADSPVGMAVLVAEGDTRGVFVQVNDALCRLVEHTRESLIGTRIQSLVHSEDAESVRHAHQAFLELVNGDSAASHEVDLRLRSSEGRLIWVRMTGSMIRASVSHIRCAVIHLQDVTERKNAEQRLAYQALHDSLTGLANRELFGDRLRQAIARMSRHRRMAAVVMLNLDGFKNVNDALGRSYGDQVLVEMATRLMACVRPSDTVARLGGDEFLLLLEDFSDPDQVGMVADRVVASIARPMRCGSHELCLGASIGIVNISPGESPEDIMRDADVAREEAKQRGGGCHSFFEPSMRARALERLALSVDLHRALTHRQLLVHYQPCLSLASGKILGVEALLRWHHPERGLISPLSFVPIAEQTGDIVPIGRWVLEHSCRQAVDWTTQDGSPLAVSINVSGRQLQTDGLVRDVSSILETTGLDPRRLTLEITESVLMNDVEEVIRRLKTLKDLGVSLAIDDFGTGYSSLAYLRRLPIDVLKIDRSFVQAASGEAGEALLRAIIGLSTSLRLKTVAEGVEELGQDRQMRALGCDSAQGFLYARPMSSEALADHLRDEPALVVSRR